MNFTPRDIEVLADAIFERLAVRLVSDTGDQIGDVHDAAKWLKASVPTIERMVRSGRIRSFSVGRLRRFRRSEVLAGTKADGGEQ
jgi:excisionase family DNA binding protein